MLGWPEGDLLGAELGTADGFEEGIKLLLGCIDGRSVGDAEMDGILLGTLLGAADG